VSHCHYTVVTLLSHCYCTIEQRAHQLCAVDDVQSEHIETFQKLRIPERNMVIVLESSGYGFRQ
jgi:hypothetical protein